MGNLFSGSGGSRHSRRLQFKALGAASLALVNAACGGDQATPAPAASGPGTTPVRLAMFNQGGDQQSVTEWNTMLEPFTKKYPNVTFDVTGPDATIGPLAFVEKATALAAGGTPPDLTYSVTRNGPTIFARGFSSDMNTLVKTEKIDLKDVSKPVLDNFDWRGSLLALPYDIGYAYVQYNRSLFAKAGVGDPGKLWESGKWNWDSFLEMSTAMARSATADDARVPYLVKTWEGDYLTIMRTHGGEILSPDRTKLLIDQGASVTALQLWADLAAKHKVSTSPTKPPQGGFNGGRLGMEPSHPGNIRAVQKFVKDNNSPYDWDIVPFPAPAGKKPVPVLFTNGLYAWKASKNQAQVASVLKFLMEDEQMLRYGALTGRDPARGSLQEKHLKNLGIPETAPKSWPKVYTEMAPLARGVPWTVDYIEWHTMVQKEILEPIADGTKTVQAAIAEVMPKVQAVLSRNAPK